MSLTPFYLHLSVSVALRQLSDSILRKSCFSFFSPFIVSAHLNSNTLHPSFDCPHKVALLDSTVLHSTTLSELLESSKTSWRAQPKHLPCSWIRTLRTFKMTTAYNVAQGKTTQVQAVKVYHRGQH